jgi:hypothetical protein
LGYDGAISYGITRQYVKTRGWGVWQAFREIVQNALDEMQYVWNIWPDAYPCFNIDTNSVVSDLGRGLAVRHLLVGTSEKPEWSRGRFGEGLKLALMVLINLGVPVYIRSGSAETGSREIRPTFVQVNIEGAPVDVFCVCYKSIPENIVGTQVYIGDPTLCDRFRNNFVQGLPIRCRAYTLMETETSGMPTKWGHILDCDEARGKIYVRDIYVRDMPAFFGYNLFDVRLSESRDIASESDIRSGIEELWEGLMWDLNRERTRPGSYDPNLVKRWTDLLSKLIDSALKSSMAGGKEVENEIYPVTYNYVMDIMTDLFTSMYGKYAAVVTKPEELEFAKYIGMNPIFFCTTPFCQWLSRVTKTSARMSEKVGTATVTVPKDKLPEPLKSIINDLEGIADYVTRGVTLAHDYVQGVVYAYLKEGVCGETEHMPTTRVALSISCLMDACKYNAIYPDAAATYCIREYISTLLHEVAHAVSGAPDGSTLFERSLTNLLGYSVTNTFTYYKEIKQYVDRIISKLASPPPQ